MKIITKEIKAYQFDELSEEIKEKVIQEIGIFNTTNFDWSDNCKYAMREICKEYGIKFEKIHSFDLDYHTFAFEGEIVDMNLLLDSAGIDQNSILGKLCPENLTIAISNKYYPDNYMDLEVYADEWEKCKDSFNNLQDILINIQNKCLPILKKEYDYYFSEEYAKDIAKNNDYWFTKEGELI